MCIRDRSYTIPCIIISHTPYHHISYSVSSYTILRITICHTKGGEGMQTLAEMGRSQWENQDGFESVMIYSRSPWMDWRVPICLSQEGLFTQDGKCAMDVLPPSHVVKRCMIQHPTSASTTVHLKTTCNKASTSHPLLQRLRLPLESSVDEAGSPVRT